MKTRQSEVDNFRMELASILSSCKHIHIRETLTSMLVTQPRLGSVCDSVKALATATKCFHFVSLHSFPHPFKRLTLGNEMMVRIV